MFIISGRLHEHRHGGCDGNGDDDSARARNRKHFTRLPDASYCRHNFIQNQFARRIFRFLLSRWLKLTEVCFEIYYLHLNTSEPKSSDGVGNTELTHTHTRVNFSSSDSGFVPPELTRSQTWNSFSTSSVESFLSLPHTQCCLALTCSRLVYFGSASERARCIEWAVLF